MVLNRLYRWLTRLVDLRFGALKLLSNWVLKTDNGYWVRVPESLTDLTLQRGNSQRFHLGKSIGFLPLGSTGEEVTLIAAFPKGGLGNRIFQLAIGNFAAQTLGTEFVMISRPESKDEGFFGELLRLANVSFLERQSKTSPKLNGYLHPKRKLAQIDFMSLPSGALLPSKQQVLCSSFRLLRESMDRLPSNFHQLSPPPATNGTSPVDVPVLHVRGTDRLLLPSPEEVRPPPLAFYLYAALIHGSKVVRIVTDDSSDPLVEELVSRLDSFGIEATFSGGSLNEDISCLANAKTLVLPGSSLSDSIAGLSSKVERIFLFEGKFFTRDDVLTLRIEDTTGSWRRSYEDIARDFPIKVRKLMASFSYEALSHRVEGDIRV